MVENYLDYPSIIQIETTNLCNATCVFCANNLIKDKGTMDDKLYKKILIECQYFPQLGACVLSGTGEPLLDPNYINRLKLAREMLNGWIIIYTNGSLLTDEVIKEMAKIKGLYLIVSINAAHPDTRKELMGLSDYSYVVNQIKKAETAGISIGVSIVDYPSITQYEKVSFIEKWKYLPSTPYDGSEGLFMLSRQNFGGNTFDALGDPRGYCFRAIYIMNVLWNGLVNACCMDVSNKIILGNCNENTLKEIWTSDLRKQFVQQQLWGGINKIELCSHCTQPRETKLLRKHNIEVVKS